MIQDKDLKYEQIGDLQRKYCQSEAASIISSKESEELRKEKEAIRKTKEQMLQENEKLGKEICEKKKQIVEIFKEKQSVQQKISQYRGINAELANANAQLRYRAFFHPFKQ